MIVVRWAVGDADGGEILVVAGGEIVWRGESRVGARG